MILYAFDIPEQRKDRSQWLERMVTGIHLRELVGELRAVHNVDESVGLASILGDRLPDVLQNGFSQLSEAQLQTLLTNPDALFELQDEVLQNGSDYWYQLSSQQDELSNVMPDCAEIVKAAESAEQRVDQISGGSQSRVVWYKHPLLVALTTAAALLVAVNFKRPIRATGCRGPAQVI